MATKRVLSCCVCGADAGYYEQHWNRDTGFGVCTSCVAWVRGRGETEAEIRDLYGVEGVNFAKQVDNEGKEIAT